MRTPRPLTDSQVSTATWTGATRHHGIHISDHEVVHFKRQTGVATQTQTSSSRDVVVVETYAGARW
jgi:hypothetical protein